MPVKVAMRMINRMAMRMAMAAGMVVVSLLMTGVNVGAQAEREGTTSGTATGNGLEISLWAREPMLKNPVALSFDHLGILYVVETARRSTVDIDIRSHKEWVVEDLANQSVDDLRQFFRRKMAPELSDRNSNWLKDRNGDGIHDWKDLTTIKERVHLLEDSDGDGMADTAQVFYEGFNEEINGVIAGVMPNGEDVLVTVYPDLWRLRDTDGDGVADESESLFRGFGVHAAYDGHDIHGLTWGPDGKIYFSVGDNGFSVTSKEGKKLHYPNTGGVLRMNPDYSDLEVFAYGLRNVQEIAFDQYGNLFSVDNDGDLEDERERFVYITEGSDAGWRLNWQFRTKGWARFTDQPDYNPWTAGGMWKPHFDGQPAHITPPLSNYSVGPGGFKYNPGTALNDRYHDFFFCVQFPVKKITAFRAQPKGAYFEMVDEHVFHSGLMASAVNFAPSGEIFIADWDGMWSPNEKGAIFRMDDPKVTQSALRQEVKQLLNQGAADLQTDHLVQLLGHADQRVRQMAQFELAHRNQTEHFLSVAVDRSARQLARIHALWGLAQSGGRDSANLVDQLPFQDPDPEIRAQAAKIAGDLKLKPASDILVSLLMDDHPRVQFFAALSLGKCSGDSAIAPLVGLLESNDGRDAYLRHASVMGLVGIGNSEALAQLVSHPSPEVRIGAVLALRRLKSSAVSGFLTDPHLHVQREAVSAIHDDFSIPQALPALAERLEAQDLPQDEAIIRRAISANLRLGEEAHGSRLIAYAANASHPDSLRVEALESLADWKNHPFVDRVEGRVRELSPTNPAFADEMLALHLPELLADPQELVSQAAAQITQEKNLKIDDAMFAGWVRSPERSVTVRADALRLLHQRNADILEPLVEFALTSDIPHLMVTGWEILANQNTTTFLSRIDKQFRDLSTTEQQSILHLSATMKNPSATRLISDALDQWIDGTLPPELHLDVLESANKHASSSLTERLNRIISARDKNDPLAPFRPALFGGDPDSGKDIYNHHVTAQCVRCHDAGGEGNQVGPPLEGIGSRVSREYLLQALIDPSAAIAKGYQSILISLTNGDSHSGRLLTESPESLTLQTPTGSKITLPKASISERSDIKFSTMPPMGYILKPTELRDLLEYLTTLK